MSLREVMVHYSVEAEGGHYCYSHNAVYNHSEYEDALQHTGTAVALVLGHL